MGIGKAFRNTVIRKRTSFYFLLVLGLSGGLSLLLLHAQGASFHNAPKSAQAMKNPYAGQGSAVSAGKALYANHCASCHGTSGQGMGDVPPLAHGALHGVPDGAIFWYITKGDTANGMPSWASLAKDQRWKLVTYLKAMSASSTSASAGAPAGSAPAGNAQSNAPPPKPPFTDYRYEKPGTFRHVRLSDLPAPYASPAAANGPNIVPRPANAWPKTLPGFKVGLYATGLHNPRILRMAPNGDIFLAETSAGDIKVFRGMTKDGKPEQVHVFATGLNTPFGIAFYPLGAN
ncbi:MAG: c-type cytochrome, partial [Terriglobia bacterium]